MSNNKVKAESIDIGIKLISPYIVEEGSNSKELYIIIEDVESDLRIKICFHEDVLGYRVLDEGNLLEFWPECSLDKGVLFEIKSGGWFDQESKRSGFLIKHAKRKGTDRLREYLITGSDDCVSVLSGSKPHIEKLSKIEDI